MEQVILWLKGIRWLDIATILIIMLNMLNGIMKGWVYGSISLAAVSAGVILSARYAGLAQTYLGRYISSPAISVCLGFIVIFAAVTITGNFIGKIITKSGKKGNADHRDRFWGAMLGVVKGAIMVAVMLVMVNANLKQGNGIIANSRVSHYFQPLSSQLVQCISPNCRRYFIGPSGPLARLEAAKRRIETILEKDRQRIKDVINKHN